MNIVAEKKGCARLSSFFVPKVVQSSSFKDPTCQHIFHLSVWTTSSRISEDFGEKKEDCFLRKDPFSKSEHFVGKKSCFLMANENLE